MPSSVRIGCLRVLMHIIHDLFNEGPHILDPVVLFALEGYRVLHLALLASLALLDNQSRILLFCLAPRDGQIVSEELLFFIFLLNNFDLLFIQKQPVPRCC